MQISHRVVIIFSKICIYKAYPALYDTLNLLRHPPNWLSAVFRINIFTQIFYSASTFLLKFLFRINIFTHIFIPHQHFYPNLFDGML